MIRVLPNYVLVVLNVAKLSQALAEIYARWFYSICTVYWVIRVLLNCKQAVLNFAELSQALADLYAGWFYSIWTVYWVIRFLLNCLLLVLNVAELWLICMLGNFTLSELSIGWLESYWTVVLNVAELSQALAEPLQVWFYSCWTANWLTWLWLNLMIWLQRALFLVTLLLEYFGEYTPWGWLFY